MMLPAIPGLTLPAIKIRTAIELVVGIVLLTALGFQTARIEGFQIWPIHIQGYKAEVADLKTKSQDTQNAFDTTVKDYRGLAAQIKAEDEANLNRVKLEAAQTAKERHDAYTTRIASADAAIARLRGQVSQAGTNSSSESRTPVSSIPTPTCGVDSSTLDSVTRAYHCAIQLDELIKWVNQIHSIKVNSEEKKDGTQTTNGAGG